jgi:hypothetical protein
MKRLLFLCAFVPTLALSQVDCGSLLPIVGPQVVDTAEIVLQAAQQEFKEIMKLEVMYAGKGNLSLQLNPVGDVEAVKFYYKNGSDVKVYVVTTEEFNQGKAIEYPPQNGSLSPLRLSVIRPPGLNPGKESFFNLEIITDYDPLQKRSHRIKLSREGNKWVVESQGARAKQVVLHPGIFFGWDGTFQKVEFK